jgi:hypothetical protein
MEVKSQQEVPWNAVHVVHDMWCYRLIMYTYMIIFYERLLARFHLLYHTRGLNAQGRLAASRSAVKCRIDKV